jgi:hypothetical protein
MQGRRTALVSFLVVIAVTVRTLASRLKRGAVLILRSAGRFQTFGNRLTVCNVINVCLSVWLCDRKYSGLLEW